MKRSVFPKQTLPDTEQNKRKRKGGKRATSAHLEVRDLGVVAPVDKEQLRRAVLRLTGRLHDCMIRYVYPMSCMHGMLSDGMHYGHAYIKDGHAETVPTPSIDNAQTEEGRGYLS